MAKPNWTPWHQVVQLREDVLTGELSMAAFAADLNDVMLRRGKRPVYEDPAKFFALTFPTVNLRQLAKEVMLRLKGKNQKAVRQLELTYGGGKTHALITLLHLVREPKKLPELPAVKEFRHELGEAFPQARVACLPFDYIDGEKGIETLAPDGTPRALLYPWSVLAWQLAGEEGLCLLHAEGKPVERKSPPATNVLEELLSLPSKQGLGTLVLLDEVLLYVRMMVKVDPDWVGVMKDFFQYLTQAATKVDTCCIVASLLASKPGTYDDLGKRIQGELYDIFSRAREAAIEPVQKQDVAEVLKRRFFTPESVKDKDSFRPHVITVRKALETLDESAKQNPAALEARLLDNYPFHPDLTEVFYENWTQLPDFQKARGILRTFALALREAQKWGDTSPLIGPAVFLRGPEESGLGDALRELVIVADFQPSEGQKTAWTGILEGELARAKQIQGEAFGLKHREIEQATVATFLHSQPTGHEARLRELVVLVGPTAPDRIELDKGLIRWAQESHWLDDRYSGTDGTKAPQVWRLGNRPNLKQMHAVARQQLAVKADLLEARLIDEVEKCKKLVESCKGSGASLAVLPKKPSDLEDDGRFHYVILGPKAASGSGKPSPEAKRFLDETTASDRPRVFRNAVVLMTASRDGLDLARSRVLDLLAWDQVAQELEPDRQKNALESSRLQTLISNSETARQKVPEAIRQAWCIVVTVAEDNSAQAFKVNVTDDPLFITVKNDKRTRIEDTAITAEALLPGGPYDLWHEGEKERRVKDLVGAFAQTPALPKMLNTRAIHDTLLRGCEDGAFVLRLPRPDHTFRAWWRSRPDDASMGDAAMEVVLTEHATVTELPASLLAPDTLPDLWQGGKTTMQSVIDYFSGTTVVKIPRQGFDEPQRVPKADPATLETAVTQTVQQGIVWLVSGPASLWKETVPPGVLNASSELLPPPDPVAATSLFPEALPSAWSGEETSALALHTALSQQRARNVPWGIVAAAIGDALRASLLELSSAQGTWPCTAAGAAQATFKVRAGASGGGGGGGGGVQEGPLTRTIAEFTSEQLQSLVDVLPELMKTATVAGVPMRFMLDIQVGTEKQHPDAATLKKLQELLTQAHDKARFDTRYR